MEGGGSGKNGQSVQKVGAGWGGPAGKAVEGLLVAVNVHADRKAKRAEFDSLDFVRCCARTLWGQRRRARRRVKDGSSANGERLQNRANGRQGKGGEVKVEGLKGARTGTLGRNRQREGPRA